MLSFPDRQRKFEQLRAHWEAAETGEGIKMVGRREKQAPHHVVHEDLQNNAGSKFRRKLSHGLALISLTQRKSVPGRQLSSNASLAVSAPSTNDSSTAILEHDALLSPQADTASVSTSGDPPTPLQDGARASEDLQTPRQLPRSRTFSYIPRPVKLDADAQPVVELDESNDASLDTVMTDSKPLPPSRIPTPSPPQSKRRGSSPRQYLPSNSSLQASIATNRQSFMGIGNGSPAKATVRSRTTPNLVKATNTSQPASYMAPRRPGLKRPFASSTLQKPVLAENVPMNKRVAQRRSQIQDKAVKRESLAVPSAAFNRRSFGPGAPLAQNKRASFATPSASAKRLSSHLMRTPVTARGVSPKVQEGFHEPDAPRSSEEAPVIQSQSKDSESSPTPTLSTVDLIDPPLAPPPRLDVDNDTQRRTLGTPNGLGGVWRSSKVFAAANYQVRRFPRSSTFHHFGRRSEAPPPVPPIPHQYKPPSSSNLIHSRSTEAASVKSMSTFASVTASEVAENADEKNCTGTAGATSVPKARDDAPRPKAVSTSSSNLTALPPVLEKLNPKRTRRSISVTRSVKPTGDLHSQRHWSLTERFYPDSADNLTRVQVKDYMPPLYWAGRFQSRFDQWRTEAMVAVLNTEVKPEDEGPLGQCGLDDERKATILIFMQLRDLCASTQAADSLHEFEYRYRKDHKMLDTKHDLPPSLRKPEESTPKGPIGRAVRKLTPRKASFANLFKGKGWNRNDDTKPVDVPGHVRELQEITDLSSGLEATDSDSFESGSRQHAR
ncbi:hypothetical protein BU25DRAFT_464792 [Macroventuria anomochaeta]|uniref:Uncharacterized protein n=1 Tax=Macroventuria anomochaeta TaxID=301207 RepID=A0ACB6SHB8_9PLEO|nr:uncharacterized protein BU25DRAFT_464792 [Macroventuria anomochaeta]KAF2633631.1 hypothetical protein BU25DRAFT_464792 [Macroventuria anomochaeta]